MLEVHLSHSHGEVKWYKDGEKLQDTGRVRLEEDGVRRSLIVLGATGRDAGEYLCDTGNDSIIFFVTVEGEQEIPWGWPVWQGPKVNSWLLPGSCGAGLGGSKHGEAGGGSTGSKGSRNLCAAQLQPEDIRTGSRDSSTQHRLLLLR